MEPMSKLFRCFVFSVTVSVLIHESYSAEIIFYDFPDYEGSVFTLTITGRCYTFKPKWSKRASSVDVQGDCFKVWDQDDCKGTSARLTKGMGGLQNLERIGFDKRISSISLCPPEEAIADKSRESDGYPPSDKDKKDGSWSWSSTTTTRTEKGKDGTEVSKTTETTSNTGSRRGGSTAGLTRNKDFWDVAVEEHNKYRRRHGVPDIKGDQVMHEDAQEYADHLAQTNKFETSFTGKYGENLATSSRRDKAEAIRDAIRRWYDKQKFYDYDRPGYNVGGRNTGSFTAIVWKATKHLGIGISWNEIEEQWIVVAFYDPPARRSQFRENVPPPTTRR